MEDNEYTSRLDAAEMLSVSKRTLDRYADTGRLRRYRRLGRVFYKTEDLRALNQPT
jgi:DNA-binding transcriptional MerR regulator